MHCRKISPKFECQGQMSKVKVKVTGDKNEKVRHFFESGLRGAGGGGPLCQWENQPMLSSASTLHYNNTRFTILLLSNANRCETEFFSVSNDMPVLGTAYSV